MKTAVQNLPSQSANKNSMQKKDAQTQEAQEITALTKRVKKLEEQQTEMLSALEEAAKNQEAAQAENRFVFSCKNTGRICLFTNTGQLYTVKVSDLPFGKFRDKAIPLDNVSNFDSTREQLLLAELRNMQLWMQTECA